MYIYKRNAIKLIICNTNIIHNTVAPNVSLYFRMPHLRCGLLIKDRTTSPDLWKLLD